MGKFLFVIAHQQLQIQDCSCTASSKKDAFKYFQLHQLKTVSNVVYDPAVKVWRNPLSIREVQFLGSILAKKSLIPPKSFNRNTDPGHDWVSHHHVVVDTRQNGRSRTNFIRSPTYNKFIQTFSWKRRRFAHGN